MHRSLPAPLAYWQVASDTRVVRLPIDVGADVDVSEFFALEFRANDRLLWSVDLRGEAISAAQARARHEMTLQATRLGVANFEVLVRALATDLHWNRDQALALALVFVFPGPYALERVGVRWDASKSRGRRTMVERAARVQKLAFAWVELTRTPAGISKSYFLKAFAAAAPYLGLDTMRGRPLADAEKFLRQERKKLQSSAFVRVRPPHQGAAGDLQLTTPMALCTPMRN